MALPPWENQLWWLGSLWKAASFASLRPEHFWGVETLRGLAWVYRGLGLSGLVPGAGQVVRGQRYLLAAQLVVAA
jgi:hypothetical protein